jgi:hypothetical protein
MTNIEFSNVLLPTDLHMHIGIFMYVLMHACLYIYIISILKSVFIVLSTSISTSPRPTFCTISITRIYTTPHPYCPSLH